ncbi:MAG: hypothetical protein AVDCRST_MAG89-1862, partial [uncultured Gemmatimonadetes bacterium]
QGWRSALDWLARAHGELLAAVQAFPDDELSSVVGDERDRPLGAGVSFAVMLHGTAQHYAYHAGQAALLRRASADPAARPSVPGRGRPLTGNGNRCRFRYLTK